MLAPTVAFDLGLMASAVGLFLVFTIGAAWLALSNRRRDP